MDEDEYKLMHIANKDITELTFDYNVFTFIGCGHKNDINDLYQEENFDYDQSTTYFRQMLNANQGTKDAGNQWYALLCKVLIED